MKVKDLLSILSSLDSEMEVKMYLFSSNSINLTGDKELPIPFRVDCYNINDVLISSYGNSVLLSSKLNLYNKV